MMFWTKVPRVSSLRRQAALDAVAMINAGMHRENGRRWGEAALAMDDKGRILLLFSRTPLSMHQFNNFLLASPLGILRAHHLEGGPKASLSIDLPSGPRHFCGSFETGFNENDAKHEQWPLPNVIAVFAGDG